MKFSVSFVLSVLLIVAVLWTKLQSHDETAPRHRTYFWDQQSFHRDLDEEGEVKLCYVVKDGKVRCLVHAWMTDNEKSAIENAPVPLDILRDFHRPTPVNRSVKQ